MKRRSGQKSPLRRSRTPVCCLLITAAVMFCWPAAVEAKRAKVIAVIVHSKSPLSNLSRGELKVLFQKRRRSWPNGKTVIPINNAKMRQKFDKLLLGMSKAQMGAFWVEQAIKGQSRPPRSVSSAALALRLVAALPGAISYVQLSQVDAKFKSKVKVISIDGVSPHDPKYGYKY